LLSSTTKCDQIITMTCENCATPKVAAKHELLINKPATGFNAFNTFRGHHDYLKTVNELLLSFYAAIKQS